MYIVVKSAMYIHKLNFTFNSPDSIVYSHTYMLVLLARLSQGRGESILSSHVSYIFIVNTLYFV